MNKKMNNLLHRIAHWLGWNHGICHSFYKGEKLMMSFKCSGCGKLSGVHCVDKIVDRELNNQT